ncbi:MAG: glycosyltransferase family 87 protein [Rubrobacteraceae bacterium]
MRFLVKRYPALLILLLLPLLYFVLALAPGPQMNASEAGKQASFVPELDKYYAKPTVETSAKYNSGTDEWRVVLTEQASGKDVARLMVDDDTGTVSGIEIGPQADTMTYPKLDKEEAMKLANAHPRVQNELSEYGNYVTDAEFKDGEWIVHYWIEEGKKQTEVARAGINDENWKTNYVFTGDQVGWQMARGDFGAYGKEANYWWVWGPMALVFALAFLRTDKLYSMRNLDVLMMLSFLVSHGFFRAGVSYEAVLLWYPPLIYLLIRTLLMGFGIGERVEKTSSFPTWLLVVLAVAASGLVLGLNYYSRVIDVGYAGVVGGDLILNGVVPYGNFPSDVGTGDTYGPLNYLIYVPAVMIFGFSGEWGYLPAAHAVTIFAFLLGAAALLFAGWRYSNLRTGAALFLAWAVFPYTLYSTNNNTNDILVAAVTAVGLALVTSPVARGVAITAGFAIKLYPLLLAPLWMRHDDVRRGPILNFILGGAAVISASFWVLFLDGKILDNLKLFYNKTLAFQGERDTPWTIFTQIPQTEILQSPLIAAVILLGFVLGVFPQVRTVRRLAALSAALVIAFELTTSYWFYPYITWFQPFIFLALLPATNEKMPLDGKSEEKSEVEDQEEQEAKIA